jgi:hypothetical protein
LLNSPFFLALLSRFSRMGQLHPGEINLEAERIAISFS